MYELAIGKPLFKVYDEFDLLYTQLNVLDLASEEYIDELTNVSVLNCADFDSKNLIVKCREIGTDSKLKNRLN